MADESVKGREDAKDDAGGKSGRKGSKVGLMTVVLLVVDAARRVEDRPGFRKQWSRFFDDLALDRLEPFQRRGRRSVAGFDSPTHHTCVGAGDIEQKEIGLPPRRVLEFSHRQDIDTIVVREDLCERLVPGPIDVGRDDFRVWECRAELACLCALTSAEIDDE